MDVELVRRAAGGDTLCLSSIEQIQWKKWKVLDKQVNEIKGNGTS